MWWLKVSLLFINLSLLSYLILNKLYDYIEEDKYELKVQEIASLIIIIISYIILYFIF